MRITQGTFSFLDDLTDREIEAQIAYGLEHGWAIMVEYSDDPHPRNTFWEMWGHPMFDIADAAAVMMELRECRRTYGDQYIRVSGFDSSAGWESVRISFLVNRPEHETQFRLVRTEGEGRRIGYTTEPVVG